MTADPRFARRVARLAATSVVALGLIFMLWALTRPAGVVVGVALAAGWILMPSLLVLSLRQPLIRYGMVVPAGMVGAALLATCLSALPQAPAARAGWLLITAGVLFGGLLGAWFWYRWLPVPAGFRDPFGPSRWMLIVVHVGLIVIGIGLVGLSTLT